MRSRYVAKRWLLSLGWFLGQILINRIDEEVPDRSDAFGMAQFLGVNEIGIETGASSSGKTSTSSGDSSLM